MHMWKLRSRFHQKALSEGLSRILPRLLLERHQHGRPAAVDRHVRPPHRPDEEGVATAKVLQEGAVEDVDVSASEEIT